MTGPRPLTMLPAFYPPAGEPCDCDAEGALDVTLAANGASPIYAFDAAGEPTSLSISLNWTNTGGGDNWPADLVLALSAPDGACAAIGGFNRLAPQAAAVWGITPFGPPHGRHLPTAPIPPRWDLTGSGLSGSGSWSAYLFNGYSGSSGAQFNATWTVSGLCNGSTDGGGGGTNDCPPDLDGDGTVTVSDALILLGDFGCPVQLLGRPHRRRPDHHLRHAGLPRCLRRTLRINPLLQDIKKPRQSGAFSYPERDLNPHGPTGQRILSPSCLPIPPSGRGGEVEEGY